jgi:hypothetical protein
VRDNENNMKKKRRRPKICKHGLTNAEIILVVQIDWLIIQRKGNQSGKQLDGKNGYISVAIIFAVLKPQGRNSNSVKIPLQLRRLLKKLHCFDKHLLAPPASKIALKVQFSSALQASPS